MPSCSGRSLQHGGGGAHRAQSAWDIHVCSRGVGRGPREQRDVMGRNESGQSGQVLDRTGVLGKTCVMRPVGSSTVIRPPAAPEPRSSATQTLCSRPPPRSAASAGSQPAARCRRNSLISESTCPGQCSLTDSPQDGCRADPWCALVSLHPQTCVLAAHGRFWVWTGLLPTVPPVTASSE